MSAGDEAGRAGAEPPPPVAEAAPPYRLLWAVGAVALALSLAAFVLWGTSGAAMLFDMVVALCF